MPTPRCSAYQRLSASGSLARKKTPPMPSTRSIGESCRMEAVRWGDDPVGPVTAPARPLWTRAEPLHALTYFAPESHAAYEAVGLRGFWRGYFAGRAAPLGTVAAPVVTATLFGFHPDFVARAIPSVWELVTPAGAIAARLAGIDA